MASTEFAFVTDALKTLQMVVLWQYIPKEYQAQVQLGGTLTLPFQPDQVKRIVRYWVDKNVDLLQMSDYQEMWTMTNWWEQVAFVDRYIDQLPVEFVAQHFPRYLAKRKNLNHPDFHWITVTIVPTLDWQTITASIPQQPETTVTLQYRLALGNTTCCCPPFIDTTFHPVCEFQLLSETWTLLDANHTRTDLKTITITPEHFAARVESSPLHCWHSEDSDDSNSDSDSDSDSDSKQNQQEQDCVEAIRQRINHCLADTPDNNQVIQLCRECGNDFGYQYEGDVQFHPSSNQVDFPCHLNSELTVQCFIGQNISASNLFL